MEEDKVVWTSLSTADVPSSTSPPPVILPPPSHPDHPSCTRCAPHCLNPNDFGAYGCQKESIVNAYKDLLNGKFSANNAVTDNDYSLELLWLKSVGLLLF